VVGVRIGVVVGVGDGSGVKVGVGPGVGVGAGVACGDTFHIHVCITVPFVFDAIAEIFHTPVTALLFV